MTEETKKQKKERDWSIYFISASIILAGALIAGAIVATRGGQGSGLAQGGNVLDAKVTPVSEKDHVKGPAKPDVYFIEYSDFRCGFCGRFNATVQQILKEYDGKVAWVYRHTPYQPGGYEAAVASECISELVGKDAFWQYADKVFANQSLLSDAWNAKTAEELGANKEAFATCYTSKKFDELFKQQTTNAQELGGQGTPYNVLLTRKGDVIKFSGALPIEQVRAMVDRALKSL